MERDRRWFLLEQEQSEISLTTVLNGEGSESPYNYPDLSGERSTRDLSGTVEVDETYLGGQWKNERKVSGFRDLKEDVILKN